MLPSVGEVRHVVIMFILDSERQLLSAQGGAAVNKPDHNILVNISEHLGLIETVLVGTGGEGKI